MKVAKHFCAVLFRFDLTKSIFFGADCWTRLFQRWHRRNSQLVRVWKESVGG